MNRETKQCPYCGEEVLKEAKKCKYCGEWFEQKDSEESTELTKIDFFKSILFIIILICIFAFVPNPFAQTIEITNQLTGEKVQFPVETISNNGIKEYCVKISILEGNEHSFCSENKEDLTNFVTKVKTEEIKTENEMTLKNQTLSKELTKMYSLDKMIYITLQKQYNIKEYNLKEEQEKIKIKKAIEKYNEDLSKEKSKEFGVSINCAKDYITVLNLEGIIDTDLLSCTKKENQLIKNHLNNEKSNNVENYPLEPIFGNNGMPKSLVLQDVPIMCFEKANLSDNSHCSKSQLKKIKEFFNNESNIDWGKEYFDY